MQPMMDVRALAVAAIALATMTAVNAAVGPASEARMWATVAVVPAIAAVVPAVAAAVPTTGAADRKLRGT